MFSNSISFALIQQMELKKQADQETHSKNVPVFVPEINNSTAWSQYLLLGLSKILVVIGQWLRSPQQLSF